MTKSRLWLWLEFTALFVALPVYFYFEISRTLMTGSLWLGSIAAMAYLYYRPGFSWRKLWYGAFESARPSKKLMQGLYWRLIACLLFSLALIAFLDTSRIFSLPLERPMTWLMVMLLYPILSVLPQEIIYRSFFFSRYEALLGKSWSMIIASGVAFGFCHIIFHNWVAPLLSTVGGLIFAYGYSHDRSLKWAVIEHALLGSILFTVGIGWYFYLGAWRS